MPSSYRIGDCIISPRARRVRLDGQDVRLGGRAFDLLLALIERRGRVVPSGELYDLIWPGVAIEPNNLQVQIWALRRLLGKQAVATVPRRGYQLTAEVQEVREESPSVTQPERWMACAPEDVTDTSPQAREPAVGELAGLLLDHRVVTLVGGDRHHRVAAALAVAARLASRLPGGCWRIACGAEHDPELLKSVDDILDFLDQQPALLILEECRQAARTASAAVAKVLEAAPSVRVLITAHAALRHIDERLYAIPPVSTAGALANTPHDAGLRWRPRGQR